MVTFLHPSKRKKILLLGLLFGITIYAQSQDINSSNRIYTEKKDSVFFITQSIYIDSSQIKNIELFEKLELSMNKEVLDQYIPVSTGTGFLIGAEGYFLTASHVVQHLNSEDKFKEACRSFEGYISEYSIPGYLTRSEMHIVFKEYMRIAQESEIVVIMKSPDKQEYNAEILEQNGDLDLALLKIELEDSLTPFSINVNLQLNEGDEVYTIGYPLETLAESFLNDFKPTITIGIESAKKYDEWDLQHTASTRGGYSGGPLINENGELIGVNLGQTEKAKDIYFSANITELASWLNELDYENTKLSGDL